MKHLPLSRTAAALSFALGLLATGPASSAINFGPGGDDLLNGAFNQMSFGSAGRANVTPLLYIDDFAVTKPASQAVVGSDLSFDYSVLGIGTSTVTINYSVTHNGDEFSDPFTDLRLMVATRAKGDPGALDTATPVGFASPPAAGDAAQFRILDAGAAGPSPIEILIGANSLDGSNACGAGCLPEMALQWNRASIAPGDTWTVNFMLVDDPSLVAGGRYLQSASFGGSGQQFIVGNPVPVPEPGTYALLFAGLGMLALAQRRRRPLA